MYRSVEIGGNKTQELIERDLTASSSPSSSCSSSPWLSGSLSESLSACSDLLVILFRVPPYRKINIKSTSCRRSTNIYKTVHKLCVGCLTCLWSTTLSITEVTMQLMVLANMKIIILCQRHNGILVSLNRKWRKH